MYALSLIASLVGLAPAFVSPPAPDRSATSERPNFILILLDDAGWGDLACYGNWHVQTPRLDRMAREGTLFTSFYVNSPVCSPSRLALLTGRYPGRLGVHSVQWGDKAGAGMGFAPADTAWLTQLLNEAGYRTGHFGKWHLGHPSRGPSPDTYGIEDHKTTASSGPGWDDRDNEWIAASDERIFGEALRFIEAVDERPFYVNIWSTRPHTPIAPSEAQMNVGHYQNMKAPGLSGPLPFVTPHRQYDATMTETDRQVGRLLDRLDELGLTETTLVVFTSDNGPENLVPRRNASVGSSGPFRGRKRSLYDGGVRVPFIVRWPSVIPAGRVTYSVVSGIDWLPTVCSLAGVSLPAAAPLDGEDMSDILKGADRERRSPLFWEYRFDQGGLVPLNRSPMLAIARGTLEAPHEPGRQSPGAL